MPQDSTDDVQFLDEPRRAFGPDKAETMHNLSQLDRDERGA